MFACCLFANAAFAQGTDADPATVIAEARAACAAAPDSIVCVNATARSEALMALVIAEAGNTRDRGAFIDLVRAVLADPSPEVRTSAAYALAKLGPDATDTPVLLALMRDPVSNVRAGGWAAAWMSGDAAARLVARRLPLRPDSTGYAPDDPARDFDPDALGFPLPERVEYLRLTSDRREASQLEFLTPAPRTEVMAWAAQLGQMVPLTDLLASDPATASLALGFLDAMAFGDPQVIRIAPDGDRPLRLVLVYQDILFGQTCIAVVFGDKVSLVPPEPAEVTPPDPEQPLDAAAFYEALLDQSGFKPDAPQDESDLFASIQMAYGYGAEDYLELYPEGAYASEARAIVAGPRLILDDVIYTDTDIIVASFQNLAPGASASLTLLNVFNDYATEDGQYLPDAVAGTARFDLAGRLGPGVYMIDATVRLGDDEVNLRRDFSITVGLAELATDKTEFAPGEAIVVRFSGMSGDDQDYVSVALAGSGNASYATYAYTGGVRDGSVTVLAPMTPGSYELRAFFREDESVLRASLPITVGGATSVQDVVSPDESVTEDVSVPPEGIVPTGGEPSPDARATLALDKSTYAPGEAILVTYSGMFGDPKDYVTTVAAGAPLTAYLNYVYTKGALDGTTTLVAPDTPGAYEVRAFFRESEDILRGSVAFEVR